MTKKRIPWSEGEIRSLAYYVCATIETPCWERTFDIVNNAHHNARTPDACRRKWERMKGK